MVSNVAQDTAKTTLQSSIRSNESRLNINKGKEGVIAFVKFNKLSTITKTKIMPDKTGKPFPQSLFNQILQSIIALTLTMS